MQDICESLRRYRIFLDKKKIKFDKQTKTLIFCHWFFNHQLSTDHPWNEATQFGTLPKQIPFLVLDWIIKRTLLCTKFLLKKAAKLTHVYPYVRKRDWSLQSCFESQDDLSTWKCTELYGILTPKEIFFLIVSIFI